MVKISTESPEYTLRTQEYPFRVRIFSRLALALDENLRTLNRAFSSAKSIDDLDNVRTKKSGHEARFLFKMCRSDVFEPACH